MKLDMLGSGWELEVWVNSFFISTFLSHSRPVFAGFSGASSETALWITLPGGATMMKRDLH